MASLLLLGFVFISGVRQPTALLGFWLAALVVFVVLYEFWRASLARTHTKGEFLPVALWRLAGRDRRRYGGYIIHLGVVLMSLGVIGIEIFQTQTQGTVAQGQELSLGNYSIRYEGLKTWDTPDGRNVARAELSVFKNGNFVGQIYPRRDYYYESQQPMTIPGVRSTLEDDFYVLLVDWQPISSQGATFKIFHNPLVNWVWIGGIVFFLGTLVAAWPEKDPEFEPEPARRPVVVGAKA